MPKLNLKTVILGLVVVLAGWFLITRVGLFNRTG